MKNATIKYFVYARKSTEGEDRQILSIEGQLEDIKKTIVREGLSVMETYTEKRSAATPYNRPLYTEMINRIKKGEAQGIVCWHIDRLIRNHLEYGEIHWLLQRGVIQSIWTPYREYRSEDNALLLSIEASSATQFSRDLSVKVKRGLKQKSEQGHPPGTAPLGYLNTKLSTRGANTVIKDPERWPIVRKGFDLLLSGIYTAPQVHEILNKQYGLRSRSFKVRDAKIISRSSMYRIFTNPFYYGYFYRKGILYKGAYEPMITVKEFDQVQLLLGRYGKPRPKQHVFAFTGLMKCGVCGSSITATEKTKLIKTTGEFKTYNLYHCTRRKNGAETCDQRKYISVQKLEEIMLKELSLYEIRPCLKDWAMAILKENCNKESEKVKKLLDVQISHEAKLRLELNNLVDLRISGGISEEIYFAKKAEKEESLIRVEAKKLLLNKRSNEWLKEIEEYLNFSTNVVERFKNSDAVGKKKICHDFGWNWVLKDQKLFISKQEWLQPVKNYKDYVQRNFGRLEPEKIFENKGQKASFDMLRPIVRGLRNEVRITI